MDPILEDHPMPAVEAVLAGTLALMTGYSQYLQAEANPAHRIRMGEKITENLSLLAQHSQLTPSCRRVLWQLHERWAVMASCTLESAHPAMFASGEDPVAAPGPRTLQ